MYSESDMLVSIDMWVITMYGLYVELVPFSQLGIVCTVERKVSNLSTNTYEMNYAKTSHFRLKICKTIKANPLGMQYF